MNNNCFNIYYLLLNKFFRRGEGKIEKLTKYKIKNIALAGHAVRKTSLGGVAFQERSYRQIWKIEDGNTVSDFNLEEIKRKSSIYSSLSYYEKDDFKINLLDTPGLFDYAGGMIEGIYASGCVMITVSANQVLRLELKSI